MLKISRMINDFLIYKSHFLLCLARCRYSYSLKPNFQCVRFVIYFENIPCVIFPARYNAYPDKFACPIGLFFDITHS